MTKEGVLQMIKSYGTKSKKFSFKGYDIKKYLINNKKYLKIIVAAGIALAVPLNPNLKIIVGAVGHLALSAIDFFIVEVKLK